MIALAVTLLFFLVTGRAAVALLRLPPLTTFAGRVSLSWLAGIAFSGIALHLLGMLHIPLGRMTILALLAAAAFVSIVTGRRHRRSESAPPMPRPVVPLFLLAAPLASLMLAAALMPIRDFDGRVTWLPKARAIAHEERINGQFFRGQAGLNLHNHYPLLIPLSGAAVMQLSGDTRDEAVRWIYVLIVVCGILVARDLLEERYVRSASWVMAGTAWLPLFTAIEGGALAAYNDGAVAVLAGVAALMIGRGDPSSVRTATLFLAGLVLTKNEGTVIAMAVILAGLVAGRLSHARDWLVPLSGTAGALVMLLWWRATVPPAYDEQYHVLILDLPEALPRLQWAAEAMLRHALQWEWWGWFWPVTGAALLIALLSRWRAEAVVPLVLIASTLGAYVLVLTITSWDVAELASVAAVRLLMHLVIPACWIVAIAGESLCSDGRP